jgi:hypothetical protein
VQHFGDVGFDAFMIVRDCKLDGAQTAPGEVAQEVGPEAFGFGRSDRHAEHFAAAVELTPTATTTAIDTMRPRPRQHGKDKTRGWSGDLNGSV